MKVLDEILPENLWYVVGYIVADGNLSSDGRHITIVSKDIEHLVKIRKALQIDCKIGMKASGSCKEKKYGILQFSNVNFYEWLQSIGIGPNKSLTIKSIAIDNKYSDDFIRGVIDGDGSIRTWRHNTNGLIQWSTSIFSASEKFILWIKEAIESKYLIIGKIHKEDRAKPRNPLFTLKFGKLASQILLNRIYHTGSISLTRKRQLAEACLLDPKKMINYKSVIRSGGEIGYTRGT